MSHIHLDQTNVVDIKEKKHTDPVLEDYIGIFIVDSRIEKEDALLVTGQCLEKPNIHPFAKHVMLPCPFLNLVQDMDLGANECSCDKSLSAVRTNGYETKRFGGFWIC